MGNFQESRFLGLSPRAVLLTLAVAGVVVGLFFMPPALKYLFEGSGKSKSKTAATTAAPAKQSVEQKAALNTDKLQQVQSSLGSSDQKPAAPGKAQQQTKKADNGDPQSGGFFSGWNFRVKARGAGESTSSPIPAGLSMEKLATKEAQAFLRNGAAEIKRFIKRERIPVGPLADAMATYSAAILELAGGVKGVSNDEIVARLGGLHAETLRALSAAGADRGLLMSWLSIPVVAFIDSGTSVFALEKIRGLFAPRMTLAAALIQERAPADYALGQSALANASVQLVVHATDVEMVRVINDGQVVRDFKLGRPDMNGDRIVRVTGDATGVWSFIAFDKYGAQPYSKSYAFYPRVQNFPQNPQGVYEIEFAAGSARNSLDKFFFIGSSGSRRTSDPIISTF